MTKTLTEQWRDNDLADDKLYYWRISDGQELVQNKLGMWAYRLCNDSDKIECLAPVPSYEEYKRLQEQLESDEMALTESQEIIAELKAQLNEANEVIKKYATGTTQIKAKKYEGSCYITDPFTGERERIEDWGEKYDADIPMSNDDKPAKEYLEKWGVK